MKRIFIFVLALSLISLVLPFVSAQENEDVIYQISQEQYAIVTYYRGNGSVVEIPAEYNGLPVRKIAPGAFRWNVTLEKIILPETVTIIGDGAFEECTALKEMDLPRNASSLGKGLFIGCTALERVTMPPMVQFFHDSMFEGCVKLKDVTLPVSVESMSGNNTFLGCESLNTVELFQGMKEIPNRFFSGCTALKEITLPNSVGKIGVEAFMGCKSLECIEFPKGLTRIVTSAFKDCTALKEIVLPQTMDGIGSGAFENCTALSAVYWPLELLDLGPAAFKNCVSLTQVQLPAQTTMVRESSFEGCTGLTYVELPETVTWVENRAFANCSNLETLKASREILLVGKDVLLNTAYYNNPNNWKNNGLYWGTVLMNVKPITAQTFEPLKGSTVIASGVFGSAHKISNIIIPDGITYVNDFAIENCTALKTLVVGKDAVLHGYVVVDCPNLKTVYWEQESSSLDKQYLHFYNFSGGVPYQVVGNGQGKVYQALRQISTVTYVDVHAITLGDPNGDGVKDAKDALAMLQGAVGITVPYGKQADAMDVNTDGDINAKDALEVLKFAVGKPSVLQK